MPTHYKIDNTSWTNNRKNLVISVFERDMERERGESEREKIKQGSEGVREKKWEGFVCVRERLSKSVTVSVFVSERK